MCGACDHACENEAVVLGELVFGVFNAKDPKKSIPVLAKGNCERLSVNLHTGSGAINGWIIWASKKRRKQNRNRMLNNVFDVSLLNNSFDSFGTLVYTNSMRMPKIQACY